MFVTIQHGAVITIFGVRQHSGLDDPAAQVLLGGVGIIELVEAVELLGERVRAHRVQRLGEQFVEQIALALGEVLGPLEPHVPGVLEQVALVL